MRKKAKKPEVKKPSIVQLADMDIETQDLREAIKLQTQGFKLIDVRSAQTGVRPKVWVLRRKE